MNTGTPLHERDGRDPNTFREMILFFGKVFTGSRKLNGVICYAENIRHGIRQIAPFIQNANQVVCPRCKEVCCISRHGYYTYEDLVYLFALNLTPPPVMFGRNDSEPCQYLRENGCSIERWYRPSGCNWYFCDSLLDYMEPHRTYRDFDETLREVAECWMKMVEEFRKSIE